MSKLREQNMPSEDLSIWAPAAAGSGSRLVGIARSPRPPTTR
jgi:hypothetical protein